MEKLPVRDDVSTVSFSDFAEGVFFETTGLGG